MSDPGDDVRRFLARARCPLGEEARVLRMEDLRRKDTSATDAPRLTRDQLGGRLVELSALGPSATMTSAVALVLDAQTQGEPVAWITLARSCFYPPDVAESGVDLDALVVVRAPDHLALARAAERLARSGAFGLLVLDFGRDAALTSPQQSRLVGVARQHDIAIVCLTSKRATAPSLGSLISLRAEVLRHREGSPITGPFAWTARAIKDKQRGPGWAVTEKVRAPAGLR